MSTEAKAVGKNKRARSEGPSAVNAQPASARSNGAASTDVSLAIYNDLGSPVVAVRVDAAAKLVAALQQKQSAHTGSSAAGKSAKKTKTDGASAVPSSQVIQ